MSRRNLKLVIAYDGTNYVGWQRQAEGLSIQGLLEDALVPLNGGRAVQVVGSGRTDAGVHAWAQVASAGIGSTLDCASIGRAMNARLPGDIRVRGIADAPEGFHARFWCTSKSYAYRVLNARVHDPLAARFVWHVRPRLDIEVMRRALLHTSGTHDFAAFQSTGSHVSHTRRTITEASLTADQWTGPFTSITSRVPDTEDDLDDGLALTFRFSAEGFLRHMVRGLVGTIIDIGLGRRDPDNIAHTLATGDRSAAGPTAPAHGLMLMRVEYRSPPTAPEPYEPGTS